MANKLPVRVNQSIRLLRICIKLQWRLAAARVASADFYMRILEFGAGVLPPPTRSHVEPFRGGGSLSQGRGAAVEGVAFSVRSLSTSSRMYLTRPAEVRRADRYLFGLLPL